MHCVSIFQQERFIPQRGLTADREQQHAGHKQMLEALLASHYGSKLTKKPALVKLQVPSKVVKDASAVSVQTSSLAQ